MIDDVGRSLRVLLTAEARGAEFAVTFAAPTAEFTAKRDGAVVDLFLYDVREDLENRPADFEDVRDVTGKVVGRRQPARRFKLAYKVTAWAIDAEEEHRLLATALRVLSTFQVVPFEHLSGALAEVGAAVQLDAGGGAGDPSALWSFWSATGGEPRACFDLVVTAPLATPDVMAVGPAISQRRLGVSNERPGGLGREPPPDDGPSVGFEVSETVAPRP
ncbi:MAG: DUF4255 domain-containing protein [Acidimicrobiales bacterium]